MAIVQELKPIPELVEWDRSLQEPELEIWMRARRGTDNQGRACSYWSFNYAIEGKERGQMSQVQRDYAATMARHIGRVIQDANLHDPQTLDSNLAAIAGMLRAEMQATMNMYVKLAEHLVRQKGLNGAASMLGLKAYKVLHLLRSRGKAPSKLLE